MHIGVMTMEQWSLSRSFHPGNSFMNQAQEKEQGRAVSSFGPRAVVSSIA